MEGLNGIRISMVAYSSDFNVKRGLGKISTKFDGISLRKHRRKHAQAKLCVRGGNGVEEVSKWREWRIMNSVDSFIPSNRETLALLTD